MVKRSTKLGVDKAKKPAKAKTAKAPPPPEKPATTQAEINRIGDIIKNARGTWFGLLSALVFATVTLASVKDISFFLSSEQIDLPVLSISVPITSFFWAGALLITALYTYLHLYLVQLWDALGDADPQFEGKPLADVIHPWLVSDAALRVRDRKRILTNKYKNKNLNQLWNSLKRNSRSSLLSPFRHGRDINSYLQLLAEKVREEKPSSRLRGMSLVGNLISILLVWFFGLITIGWFWWRSMPAHSIGLTIWLGLLLIWTLFIFWRSSSYALARLADKTTPFPRLKLFGICVLVIVIMSFMRTAINIGIQNLGPFSFARTDFSGVQFVKTPPNWLGEDVARLEYRDRWCKLKKAGECTKNSLLENGKFSEEEEARFNSSWKIHWQKMLSSFEKPNFGSLPLKGSNLSQSKLIGADLSEQDLRRTIFSQAQMSYIDLSKANLRGADLSFAQMQDADLFEANMQEANLFEAEMQGANLRRAVMQEADLYGAEMQGADLSEANMQGADLSEANMQEADLTGANMQGVILIGAKMQGADLRWANIQGAVLWRAQMQGAVLWRAQMQGTPEEILELRFTNLEQANFSASSLRFVDFTRADVADLRNFEESFGDGSVNLDGLLNKPDGWCESVLSDEQYWGRYLGWLKKHELVELDDEEIEEYRLIPFGTPCPEE